MRVPFNVPLNLGSEMAAVADYLSATVDDAAAPIAACEQWFRDYTGAALALMTPSCTHALEMAALLIGIGPGDEVIMPSYTFPSTANAFVLRGAVPVFVDIEPETCNMDARLVERAISLKTRAIVPVHYAGVGCDMGTLMALADKYGLVVIEDAAQGVMASRGGQPLGSIGHLGAYSFHATKNYTSGGEGGMLLVNDPRFADRAKVLRDKGTDRSDFLAGKVTHYRWLDVGSSYVPSGVQAACLLAQLEHANAVNERRRTLWSCYHSAFSGLTADNSIALPAPPESCQHNGHLYYLLLPSVELKHFLMAYLQEAGIEAYGHYAPLHSAPAGLRWGRFNGEDRYTSLVAERLLRLPLYYALSDEQQEHVISVVLAALCSYSCGGK